LEESRLGNINKKELPKNESPKGDPRGAIAELLGVFPLQEESQSFYYPA